MDIKYCAYIAMLLILFLCSVYMLHLSHSFPPGYLTNIYRGVTLVSQMLSGVRLWKETGWFNTD